MDNDQGPMTILLQLSRLKKGDPAAEPLLEAWKLIPSMVNVILVDVVLKETLRGSRDNFLVHRAVMRAYNSALNGAKRWLPEDPIAYELERLLQNEPHL